ncbi:MAG TPA: glycosyltransferase family 4 protein [Sphingomicrobium sp.]|jgi:glycosyltransferase involved in cell wall biosynthesis|nr:glycosyltransferase family 4 protein [Sphingomicrobium sp.]
MRIAYVTQWFEPEPNIIKGTEFVRALEAAGHVVTVVTGYPNYPYGRIYPGYRMWPISRETVGGIRIVRLPLYPSHDRSVLRRSATFLTFFLSALAYLKLRRSKFDMAYIYHPPITVGLAAVLAGIPFILDVQDLWPDTVVATDIGGASRLAGPLGACCRYVYARASAICTQSEGMKAALIARGVAPDKISIIRNWADAEFQEIPSAKSRRRRFTVVYGGNLGRAQSLSNLIDAAAIVERERPDIHVELFGSGVEERDLRERTRSYDLENVGFSGRVPVSEMIREFVNADALLLHLSDDPLFDITIPSKTQYYLAMGRPIVAAVNGEAGQLLRRSGAAIVVPPADPAALANAIVEMADTSREHRAAMGHAGTEFYRRHFSFSEAIGRTIALLEGTYQDVRGEPRNR